MGEADVSRRDYYISPIFETISIPLELQCGTTQHTFIVLGSCYVAMLKTPDNSNLTKEHMEFSQGNLPLPFVCIWFFFHGLYIFCLLYSFALKGLIDKCHSFKCLAFAAHGADDREEAIKRKRERERLRKFK